jgi:2'-5' RNA ligase
VPAPETVEELSKEHGPIGVPGLPVHVTVLYPFLPERELDRSVEDELERIARAHPPFPYRLEKLGRFPGVLYLEPSPAEGFIALTRAVEATWPGHPIYAGEFDEVKPHVTLAMGHEPNGLAAAMRPLLPIDAVARELVLLCSAADGSWVERRRFALGG